MFWSYIYDKTSLPFVNLSTVYEKTKWVSVSINWGNSASSLLAKAAFMNFQIIDGPFINIWISLEMFKPKIPSSKFFNRSAWVPWPKKIETQYQTWTLFFMKSYYLTKKSISHSWTVAFRLSSKDTRKYSKFKILSGKNSLIYEANPWLTNISIYWDPIPFFEQFYCQETCFWICVLTRIIAVATKNIF